MGFQPPTQPAYLRAVGAATAVGLSAEATAAAARAGMIAYRESRVFNRRFKPMKMALVPDELLPPVVDSVTWPEDMPVGRQSRMLSLAQLALRDLQSKYHELDGLTLMLAGPENLPGVTWTRHDRWVSHLVSQTGIRFDEGQSMLFFQGRAAGAWAIAYAMAFLEADRGEAVVVGGVDNYLDAELLGVLDMEGRILAEGVADGFAPSEGAAFLVLTKTPGHFQDSDVQVKLHPPGVAYEEGHRYGDAPYLGDGLSACVRQALAAVAPEAVGWLFTSLNGEDFGAKEVGVAMTRNRTQLGGRCEVHHPAGCFGDVGAAFFPLSMALGALEFCRYQRRGHALICAASDTRYRGAACISLA